MTDKPWKQMERRAAAIFGGRRFPASIGGPADFETERFVGQVKNTNRLSQGELGRLCEQIAEYGFSRGKLGVVVTKAAAGRGNETPIIISATAEVWKRILAEFRK